VRREEVRQLAQCKVALLMGCSSVLMETNGDYEPSGSVLSYLLADWYAVSMEGKVNGEGTFLHFLSFHFHSFLNQLFRAMTLFFLTE
jgi:hypothetical protein